MRVAENGEELLSAAGGPARQRRAAPAPAPIPSPPFLLPYQLRALVERLQGNLEEERRITAVPCKALFSDDFTHLQVGLGRLHASWDWGSEGGRWTCAWLGWAHWGCRAGSIGSPSRDKPLTLCTMRAHASRPWCRGPSSSQSRRPPCPTCCGEMRGMLRAGARWGYLEGQKPRANSFPALPGGRR